MTKVFVVILNWNRPQDTIECLKSIQELSIRHYELSILIIDNASSDNSVEEIKKHMPHNTKYRILKNTKNLGFAGGNNAGIKYALEKGADYVMILNNDTVVDKDLIAELLEVAKSHPKTGAVSPKIYFAKGFEFHKKRYKKSELGKVIWYAGGVIDWRNVYGKTRGVDEVDKGQFDEMVETDFATGTCMLLSRSAIEEVGMFDEKIFMYYDDTELCQRLKAKNYKIYYCPKALVWHKVSQSSGIGSELNDYFISRNRLFFGMKYASLRTKFALLRESFSLLVRGRKWEKIGVRDFYFGKFGIGSWK